MSEKQVKTIKAIVNLPVEKVGSLGQNLNI